MTLKPYGFLKRSGMKIDLGALAKGYSADLIGAFLKDQGITEALIDLGGNILTVGQHPHQTTALADWHSKSS